MTDKIIASQAEYMYHMAWGRQFLQQERVDKWREAIQQGCICVTLEYVQEKQAICCREMDVAQIREKGQLKVAGGEVTKHTTDVTVLGDARVDQKEHYEDQEIQRSLIGGWDSGNENKATQ